MLTEKEVLKYLKLSKGVHRRGYNTNMKKSGKINRFEPTVRVGKMIFLNVQNYSKGRDGSLYLKES